MANIPNNSLLSGDVGNSNANPYAAEFDDDGFRARFLAKRRDPRSLNYQIDQPTLLALLAPIRGCAILEVGCGSGELAAELLAGGTKHYVGVDVASGMIEEARRLNSNKDNCDFEIIDVTAQPLPRGPFDKCVSGLVFHFMPDIFSVFQKIFVELKPGGEFVFSLRHPLRTANPKGLQPDGASWLLKDYFQEGSRRITWHGQELRLFHRPISSVWTALSEAGFQVKTMLEIPASSEHILEADADHAAVPGFIYWKAVKQ